EVVLAEAGVAAQVRAVRERGVQRTGPLMVRQEHDPGPGEHGVNQVVTHVGEDPRVVRAVRRVPDLAAGTAAVTLPLGRLRRLVVQGAAHQHGTLPYPRVAR